MLLMIERGGLAGRAARHETMGALVDLPLNEFTEGWLVEGAVPEGRDEGRDRAMKRRRGQSGVPRAKRVLRGSVAKSRADNRGSRLRRQASPRQRATLGIKPPGRHDSLVKEVYWWRVAYTVLLRALLTLDNAVSCLLYTSPSPRDG